ncbi:phosphoglycerate dehydrogenase [Aureococcus anophagefferens]|nr:phosphoglycerate dehydrogenase [Aureococcus anophagefferens]
MDLKNQRILCEQVNAILELHMEATIVAILDEVEANLPLELDFTLEVRNMERQGSKGAAAALFRKRGFGDVVIPAAVPGLCSESVLVQEFLPGTTLAAYAKARRDLPFDLGRGVDHLLLALPLDHAWIRRAALPRTAACPLSARQPRLDRERAALDADPERFFRGLLEGADLRSRLFGHARPTGSTTLATAAGRGPRFRRVLDDGARRAREARRPSVRSWWAGSCSRGPARCSPMASPAAASRMAIKTFNKLNAAGLARFDPAIFRIAESSETNAHAILLRSHKLTESDLGVPVFNTPGANANAVKELVLCALFMSSRGVIEGAFHMDGLHAEGTAHERIEKDKALFGGREIAGKTLGVVGLGAIGAAVLKAALGFGMDVVGYDPSLSVEGALRLPGRKMKMVDTLDELAAVSDYVTLHALYNDHTKGLTVPSATNFPTTTLPVRDDTVMRVCLVNENRPGMLGDILSVFGNSGINITQQMNTSRGDVAYNVIDIERLENFEDVHFRAGTRSTVREAQRLRGQLQRRSGIGSTTPSLPSFGELNEIMGPHEREA